MEIRRANREDSNRVSTIIRSSFKRQAEILNITDADCPDYVAFEREIDATARIESSNVKLMFIDGLAVGTIGIRSEGEVGIIERLAILPEYRGKSYGEALLHDAEQELTSLGCRTIHLSIVAEFLALRAYYERNGYQPHSTERYDFLPFDVLHMTKTLY